MADAPQPFVLIDLDCEDLPIRRSGARCDFVFISDDGSWVVPLELKRGGLRVSEVLEQLRGGARFAESVVPTSTPTSFLPIAVVGGRIHPDELRRLRQRSSQVRFRGEQVRIELLRCGDSLAAALRRRSE